MNRSNDAMKHIVNVNNHKMELLEDMSEAVHIVNRVMRTIALLDNENEASTQKKELDDARQQYNDKEAELARLPLDDAGKALVARLKA
jgi:methyl-accepting chemotaxis protein